MSTHTDWEDEQPELAAMGDGLPLVPPTPQRVQDMLARNRVDPDELVVTLAPAFGEATWRGIAENAVMAGCRPQYLGVIAAALLAMAESKYNLLGIQTTTGSAGPITIVNGPVAKAIGMNAAGNALGPGNRANATIGRAISLVLRNIGGAKPGEMDMATLGHPGKYTFCLAENEEASPWPSLHATRGFDRGQSVVTVAAAAGIIEVVDSVSSKPADLIRTFASSMVYAGSVGNMGMMGSGQPLVIMPPEQAMHFHQDGMSREDVQAALFRDAGLPLERLSNAVRERVVAHRKSAGLDPDAPVRIATQPSDILIVVAGGPGVKAAYIPTWGGSKAVSREVTVQAA